MNSRKLTGVLFGAAAGALALRALGTRAQRRRDRAAPLPADAPDGSSPLGGAATGAVSVRDLVPRATLGEMLAVLGEVVLPTLAKGVIIRRPKVMALAERLDLDRRAVRRVQKLRQKYGRGPLLLRVLIRRQALILAPEHVHQVLACSPEPFATATFEKRGALSHFEPRMALISHGPERAERRRFNEAVLDSQSRAHRLAESFLPRLDEEAACLLQDVERRGELVWEDFIEAWFRMVRRVVFGDAAREDRELTDMIAQLRARANWSFLAPPDEKLRERFLARIRRHLARAEPGSLAAVIARAPKSEETAPEHQVPQWLFAFDPAAMATFRALALLASHPAPLERAREEIWSSDGEGRLSLPFLRACVLESLRLWPTTPMVLRETTRETEWATGRMPAHTHVLIFAPFFHRDDQRLPYADRFSPEVWLKEGSVDELKELPAQDWPLIPFSSGPGMCPGRHLVLLLTSNMLRALIDDRKVRLKPPTRLDTRRPLPGTLNNYSLRFELDDRGGAREGADARPSMARRVSSLT